MRVVQGQCKENQIFKIDVNNCEPMMNIRQMNFCLFILTLIIFKKSYEFKMSLNYSFVEKINSSLLLIHMTLNDPIFFFIFFFIIKIHF